MGPSNKPAVPLPATPAVFAGATAASTTSNFAATDIAPSTTTLATLATLLQSKDVRSIEAFLNTISGTPEGALLGSLWNSAMDEGLRMGSVKLEERFEDGQKIGYHEGYNDGFDEGSRSGINKASSKEKQKVLKKEGRAALRKDRWREVGLGCVPPYGAGSTVEHHVRFWDPNNWRFRNGWKIDFLPTGETHQGILAILN
ncbi:hypothetical protein FPV67DRAFT_253310 [Lyophyllum atratum]|nr:hypothetical protein FPV67DRAFT_253310 [Lyophyllum atratum]